MRTPSSILGSTVFARSLSGGWGLRYIDDAVIRRAYNLSGGAGDAGGDSDRVFTHLTDAQFSTVAMLDESAIAVERIAYDPYGHARLSLFGDVNGDSSTDGGDSDLIDAAMDKPIGDADYNPDADFNRDGVVDSTDAAMMPGDGIKPLPGGWITNPYAAGSEDYPVGTDNVFGYCGYVFNAEVELYTVRFGRWRGLNLRLCSATASRSFH